MTLTYLSTPLSTTLNSDGNGTISFVPPAGQFWAPTLIRVATNNQQNPFPYCAVYQGPVNQVEPCFFVDGTFTGQADSSSMLSGTLTEFGNAITVVWTNGMPGDTATATLFGVSSDVPPTVDDFVPEVAGIHFAGQITPFIESGIDISTFTVGANTNNPLGYFPLTLPGYRLFVSLQWNATPTNGMSAVVVLQWINPLTNDLISRQEWCVGASSAASSEPLNMSATGPIDATLLSISIWNQEPSVSLTAFLVLTETDVDYPRHDMRYQNFSLVTIPNFGTGTEPGSASEILWSVYNVVIPVSTSISYPADLYNGPAQLLANDETSGGALTVYVAWAIPKLFGAGPSSVGFQSANPYNFILYLPRAPAWITLKNTSSTVACTVTGSLVALQR